MTAPVRDETPPGSRMNVGFSGTRHGMTPKQEIALRHVLRDLIRDGAEFHHGDCVGADAAAQQIAKDVGARVHSHPPTDEKLRAFTEADVEHEPADYLVRNGAIVRATDLLVACPAPDSRGTWHAIGCAQMQQKPALVIDERGRSKWR